MSVAIYFSHISHSVRSVCVKYVQPIWDYKLFCALHFLCVRSPYGLCARAHAHTLEGTLLLGTPQQRLKFTSLSIAFHGSFLVRTSSCRNLGVLFDSDLSFNKHISSIKLCSSSFFHIRQLRQIRSSLDRSSAV